MSEGKGKQELLDRFKMAWQELGESVLSLEDRGCFMTREDSPVPLVDKKTSSRLFVNLLAQLGQMDFQAVKSWQELKPYLQNDEWTTKVAEIDSCITTFDFDKAAKLVKHFHDSGKDQ